MPDVRATIDFEGIDFNAATFPIDGTTIVYDITQTGGSAVVGRAVSLTAAGVAQLTADADHVVGKLVVVESDGYCTVQNEGFTTLPLGNAATVTPGNKFVGALGAASARGYIRGANSAVAAELNGPGGTVVLPADGSGNVMVNFD